MGKHEVIKTSSTERVRKHRAEMRAKGYRLKQRWVIDMDDPAVKERIRKEFGRIRKLSWARIYVRYSRESSGISATSQ